MGNFILNSLLWTFAIYGFIEILKTILKFNTYKIKSSDGIYLALIVKNQEKNIENFLRSLIFKILYGKEDEVKEIKIIDLDSKDRTLEILKRMEQDCDLIKVVNEDEFSEWVKFLSNK